MALKLMPGETRNYTFRLPVSVKDIDAIRICFYQNEEKIKEYDGSMTENVYGIDGEENLIVCTVPREDSLLFENRIKAFVQVEWEIDGYHSVAKAQRISVGNYLNRDNLDDEITEVTQ